jgi:hypothetical protein
MSDSSHQTPDRHRPDQAGRHHRPSTDLDLLRSHPSLAPLAGRGRQLDRLPTARTAWALAGTLSISMATLGAVSAGLVVLMAFLAVAFTASALAAGNLPAARRVLDLTRACLLAWVVVSAAVMWFDAPSEKAPPRPVIRSTVVADPAVPAASPSLGSLGSG